MLAMDIECDNHIQCGVQCLLLKSQTHIRSACKRSAYHSDEQRNYKNGQRSKNFVLLKMMVDMDKRLGDVCVYNLLWFRINP